MKRAAYSLLGALAALVLSSSARAEDGARPIVEALSLGPSRCLEASTLAQHVGMWLGRTEIDRRLAIEIVDAPEGVRFVVRREGEIVGERTLGVREVPCPEIHSAVGLGIASAIDATVLRDLGVTPAAPAPVLAPMPAPVWQPPPLLSPLPLPTPAPAAPATPAFAATLQGMVLIGVLPRVTLAIAPSAELRITHGFELRASALVTGTTTVAIGAGSAKVGLIAGRLDACASRALRDVARGRACAGILAGAANAQGFDLPSPRTAVTPWIAPAVRADGWWSIAGSFGVVVGVEGFFPGLKPELQVLDGAGKVTAARRFPLAGVGVSLGPAFTF